jgi:hypothetical protein
LSPYFLLLCFMVRKDNGQSWNFIVCFEHLALV